MLTLFLCLLSAAAAVVLFRIAQRWGKPTPESWACANEVAKALRDAQLAARRYHTQDEHNAKQKASRYFSILCAEVGPVDALKLVLLVGLSGELLSGSGPEAVIREMGSLLGVTDEALRQARNARNDAPAAPGRAVVVRR